MYRRARFASLAVAGLAAALIPISVAPAATPGTAGGPAGSGSRPSSGRAPSTALPSVLSRAAQSVTRPVTGAGGDRGRPTNSPSRAVQPDASPGGAAGTTARQSPGAAASPGTPTSGAASAPRVGGAPSAPAGTSLAPASPQAAAATPASAPASTPASTPPPPPAGGNGPCGPTISKANGTPWVCTFDDEFSGTSLDRAKWATWNGVNYNTPPLTCYFDDPSHVWVRGGYLNLAVTRLSAPTPCATPSGTAMATYGGAVVHSKYLFSQTGGRFEARIRFGGGVGVHDAFWLWPENDNARYPGHAEIDIAEPWGALPDVVYASTHVTGANGGDSGRSQACSVANWSNAFHTYAIEWQAGSSITFFVDGTQCLSFTDWSALPGYAKSAPFDQPFFMILQTLVDDGSYAPAPNASTVLPAITQVDYVRVWR